MSLQVCCCGGGGGNCDFYRQCNVAARNANANAGPTISSAFVTGNKLCKFNTFNTPGKIAYYDNWEVAVNSIQRTSNTLVSGCYWNTKFEVEFTVTAPACSGCSGATLTRTTELGFLFSCLPSDTVNFPYNCPQSTNRAIPEQLYVRTGTSTTSPLNNSFCSVAGSNVGLGGVQQGPKPFRGPGNVNVSPAWTSVPAANYQTCGDLDSGDLQMLFPVWGKPTYGPGFPFGCEDETEVNWDPLTGTTSISACYIELNFTLLTP